MQLGSRIALTRTLEGIGSVMVASDGSSDPLRAASGLRLLAASNAPSAAAFKRASLVIGPERTSQLIDEGRALPIDEAVALARSAVADLSRSAEHTPIGVSSKLSRREKEVATLLATGASNRDIGEALAIAERTVEMHVSNVLAKLGLTARAQVAAQWADQRSGALTGTGLSHAR
jgi:non-specific serine/threonine protein kinase